MLFRSNTPFEFRDGTISFKGRAGVIRVRDQTVDLTLSEPGEVALDDKTLSSSEPAFRSFAIR